MSRARDFEEPTLPAVTPSTASVPSLAPSMPPNLGGRYEILGLLGMGGMGAVYRAHDRELGEVVALKMLRPELGFDPDALAQFRKEVRLARRVTHRNVGRTYDLGEADGHRFLTMELVSGESLSDLLDRERVLPAARTMQIAADICEGLAAAHAAGVIHRDLKPANVMLAHDGRIVVMDFGIASAVGESEESWMRTAGTPAYMAPEQVQALDDVDGSVDQYALGTMMYEMLTGALPFEGHTLAAVAARLSTPPPDPRLRAPGLPDALADVVMRCLACRREDRFPSIADLGAVLGPMALSQSAAMEAAGAHARRRAARGTAIAVLPLGGRGEGEYLAQGFTDELVDVLSSIAGLRVRSRGAVAAIDVEHVDPRDAGRQLGVIAVVHGTLREEGKSFRVSLRLTTVEDGFQIWSRRLSGAKGDLLRSVDDAAADIAEALGVLRPATRAVLRDAETVDLYLRGRQEYFQFVPAANARAIELLRLAAERSPHDPVVLSAYCLALVRQLGIDRSGAMTYERARAAASAAAQAAPDMPEPQIALASVALHAGEAVAAAVRLGEVLGAGVVSADAHELAARVLFEAGALDEAARQMENALHQEPRLEGLDYVALRSRALAGDWEDAERALLGPVDRRSAFNYWASRLRLAFWRGEPSWIEGVDFQRAAGLGDGERLLASRCAVMLRERRSVPEVVDQLARACASKKLTPRARSFYQQLRAEVCAYLGDEDGAADAIRASAEAGLFDAPWLLGCPILAHVRDRADLREARATVALRARQVRQALGA